MLNAKKVIDHSFNEINKYLQEDEAAFETLKWSFNMGSDVYMNSHKRTMITAPNFQKSSLFIQLNPKPSKNPLASMAEGLALADGRLCKHNNYNPLFRDLWDSKAFNAFRDNLKDNGVYLRFNRVAAPGIEEKPGLTRNDPPHYSVIPGYAMFDIALTPNSEI